MAGAAGVGAKNQERGDGGQDDAKHDENQGAALAVALLLGIWFGRSHPQLDAS